MMMEGFDVMFFLSVLQDSKKGGDRAIHVSIEPFPRLICFMTANAKPYQLFYIIVFVYDMLALVMAQVVICNEQ